MRSVFVGGDKQLKDDVEFLWVRVDGLELDDVGVVELAEERHLVLHALEELGAGELGQVDDLHGHHLSAAPVAALAHLGRRACAQRAPKHVVVAVELAAHVLLRAGEHQRRVLEAGPPLLLCGAAGRRKRDDVARLQVVVRVALDLDAVQERAALAAVDKKRRRVCRRPPRIVPHNVAVVQRAACLCVASSLTVCAAGGVCNARNKQPAGSTTVFAASQPIVTVASFRAILLFFSQPALCDVVLCVLCCVL